MGFLSYNINYYYHELLELEDGKATKDKIYHAKQLLKLLDDLLYEGYEELNKKIEQGYQGVSRLRNYISNNHEQPFSNSTRTFYESSLTYSKDEYELNATIKELIQKAQESRDFNNDSFIIELIDFCEWIGYKDDTAYVFLLRDTLLPYIYYQAKDRSKIHPWLLGRKCLAEITEKVYIDDEIRATIYQALEERRHTCFESFSDAVFESIRDILRKYPQIEATLIELLAEIKEKHIIVVESGCSGTFPMLLMCLDKRVDIKMYTTYPYLSDLYKGKIYTFKYENNRLFETLFSQDLYLQYSKIKNGKFYVKKCRNSIIERRALTEVKTILEKAK